MRLFSPPPWAESQWEQDDAVTGPDAIVLGGEEECSYCGTVLSPGENAYQLPDGAVVCSSQCGRGLEEDRREHESMRQRSYRW